jgi:2-dehydro-3-deoxygalactonokinase
MADRLIALDWGTTSLRAALMAADGTVLDRRASADGIMATGTRSFPAIFTHLAGGWLRDHPGIPALACGMIGSRQGWVEAPYAACPAGFAGLASALVWTDEAGTRVGFVPGLRFQEEDVMRGEETQIMGALDGHPGRLLFVLPGTHSKWAVVDRGEVVAFQTFMTGEVFATLRRHSILGRLMPEQEVPFHPVAFADGCRRAEQGAPLHALFSARTEGLFGHRSPETLPSYLSGLLVGEEVREALALAPASHVHLVCSATLAAPYGAALALRGVGHTVVDGEVAFAGLHAIARAAGLI